MNITIPHTPFNITIDNKHIDEYVEILNDIGKYYTFSHHSLLDTSNQFKHYLKLSTSYERDITTESIIQNVDEYLSRTNHVPNIVNLYAKLFPSKQCWRLSTDENNGFVGVSKRNNKWFEEFYNIGIDACDINYMQQLVYYYYDLQKLDNKYVDIIGFICYLLYERIHPHYDGNGRMGRLLFIENTYQHSYYPLTETISKLRMPEIMQNIFDKVSFPYKLNHGDKTIPHHDSNDYYNLVVDDELLRGIVKCLGLCKEFKMLSDVFRNEPRMNSIITKLLRTKINDYKIDIVINNDELLDKFNRSGFNVENHNKLIDL